MLAILVVEDDVQTASEVAAALSDTGFKVDCVHNGRDGLIKATSASYDAIVLDRMLPGGMDGLTLLSTLRAVGVETPVLILSALSTVDERVLGLRTGGDDYLVKPFEYLELTARIEVLTKRQALPAPVTSLRVGELEIDLLSQLVRRANREIDVTPQEFRILELMMRHPGRLMTRMMLLEHVRGYRSAGRTSLIDVHIGKLRRKLDEGGLPPLIHTVRGSGYILRAAK